MDEQVAKVLSAWPGLEPEDEWVDDLVSESISHGMKLSRETAWIRIDLMFRDRNTGEVRQAPNMLIEVVKHGNEVLFQDSENGTHRMVALEHIENTRVKPEHGEPSDAQVQAALDAWYASGYRTASVGMRAALRAAEDVR